MYRAALEELRRLETRFAAAVEREEHAKARLRAERTAVLDHEDVASRQAADAARGRELLNGASVATHLPPSFDLAAAQEEQRLLIQLVVAARTELDAIKDQLSAEVRQKLTPHITRHRDRIRSSRAALEEATSELNGIAATLLARGYTCYAQDLFR